MPLSRSFCLKPGLVVSTQSAKSQERRSTNLTIGRSFFSTLPAVFDSKSSTVRSWRSIITGTPASLCSMPTKTRWSGMLCTCMRW